MIYAFFLSLLVNVLTAIGLFLLYKSKVKLIGTKDKTKLLETSLKEAELRLDEVKTEKEIVLLELDDLRINLETEKEKLLDSIGPKGKVIKILDKKIEEKQRKLNDLNTRVKSKEFDRNDVIHDAIEVVEFLLCRTGLSDWGNNCNNFKSDPRKVRALNWLLVEGYIHSFYSDKTGLNYTLHPNKVEKPIQEFYRVAGIKGPLASL